MTVRRTNIRFNFLEGFASSVFFNYLSLPLKKKAAEQQSIVA